jgi:phosphate transport system permease protein
MAIAVMWLGGALVVLVLVSIVIYLLVRGVPHIGWSFFTTRPAPGIDGGGGVSTILISTAYLMGFTMVLLIPLGVGAAIYLAEYAKDNKVTRAIRYAIDMLAGVPSIVFGLFGFALFVLALNFSFSILAGGLTLVCLLLPTMIRTAEESIKAVPMDYREAALALGATKWQSIWRVVLPAALPGIVTGIILSLGRALGETACLYVTMGGYRGIPRNFLASPGSTLSLEVFFRAFEVNDMDGAMAAATVLIVTILIINSATNYLAARFHTKMSRGL